jgi:response regulator RpfG family c-di-GMP phosphodiesterase
MPTTDLLHATWTATVLVADDEPAARRLLRRILEPAGYKVLEAATAAQIARPLRAFQGREPAVLHHHERFDGSGYPHGLKGGAIALAARIVAVADSFDAMTTDRPFRRALAPGEAFQRLDGGRTEQWDPDIVDVLLAAYNGTGAVEEIAEGL